jgi:large subunit ribosomal protein L2
MALKKFNPIGNASRQLVLVDRSDLHKGGPVKELTEGKKRTGGRNNMGRITVRHIGGGHKQRYRIIALVKYADGELAYILAPQRAKAGDPVIAGEKVDVKPGNAMPLKSMPIGTIVHNVELKPGKGGQIARSAGAYVQLVGRDSGNAQIKLSSGEVRLVSAECMATVGAVSNQDHMNQSFSKAGRNRWRGVRPTVRGVVMNPVDHPMGGGEGKSSGGRHPVSPWGQPSKGKKTRHNKRTDNMIVRRRNAKK